MRKPLAVPCSRAGVLLPPICPLPALQEDSADPEKSSLAPVASCVIQRADPEAGMCT